MTAPSAALASSSQPDQRFPKQARLRRRSEFLRVQGEGRRLHTPHFVVLLMPGRPQRFGVTVGKRIGCAVKRNRIKRVARELFRREKALFPADCEVVLVARTGAERLDYGAVKAELERAQASLARLLVGGPRPARGDGTRNNA
jgi:ribonuclease P protein component